MRDVQAHFDRSALFAPLVADQLARLPARRRHKQHKQHVKLGHGGTLDPLATGVLILGVGAGTKRLPGFLGCRKTYETVVLFGAATDTFDRLGRVIDFDGDGDGDGDGKEKEKERGNEGPYAHITREKVLAGLDKFRGKIWQVPPIYSAKWMNGMRLYEYARQGLPLPAEIKGKDVVVEELEMVEWLEPGMHEYQIPTEGVGGVLKGLKKKKGDEGKAVDGVGSAGAEEGNGLKRARESIEDDGASDIIATVAATTTTTTANTTTDPLAEAPPPPAKKTKTAPLPEAPMNAESHTGRNNIQSTTQSINAINANAASETNSSIAPPLPPHPQPQPESSQPQPQPQSQPPPESRPQPPAARLRLTVSSGFYVRSLCHDLGLAIGSHGLMAELVRTRQGDFELGRVRNNDKKEKAERESGKAGKEEEKAKSAQRIGRGNVLEYDDLAKGEEVWGPTVVELIREAEAEAEAGEDGNGNGNGKEMKAGGGGGGGGSGLRKQRKDRERRRRDGHDGRYRSRSRSGKRSRRNTSSPE